MNRKIILAVVAVVLLVLAGWMIYRQVVPREPVQIRQGSVEISHPSGAVQRGGAMTAPDED